MQNDGLTSIDSAKKILGDNMITPEEAMATLGCKSSDVDSRQHAVIPFGNEILYNLSEPENPFILFPGISFYHGNPLSIARLRKIFLARGSDLFVKSREYGDESFDFLHNYLCLPRWYLISKSVFEPSATLDFFNTKEITKDRWEVEPAIVYIYVWLLFQELRNEMIFLGGTIGCRESYSGSPNCITTVNFDFGVIKVGSWRTRVIIQSPSIIPSIKLYSK